MVNIVSQYPCHTVSVYYEGEMISILSTSKRGLPFFCGVFSKFIQETSITAIADKQCDVVLIILRCSTPMLCCLFEQNKIQTKENNKNKTDDHNKQVDQSGIFNKS